jgi:hypothetical protein
MTAKKLEKSASKAIRQLRKKRLQQGLPFMINSDLLPSNQCYLEYPDGSMKIVEANSKGSDFKVIEELGYFDIEFVRRRLKLIS